MAYETKALLMSLSEIALLRRAREMYSSIARIANVEGVVLENYDDAIKEIECEKEEKGT